MALLDPDVMKNIKVLWDYHHMNQKLSKSDLIMVLGNHDFNTIKQGIALFKEGYAPFMVIAGGQGVGTKGVFSESEADTFAKIAIENGIPFDKIILENKSTNTGENYSFTRKRLDENNLKYDKVIVVTKPYMERRVYATAKVHWPDVEIIVSSIPLSLEDYLKTLSDPEQDINFMVGDLQRIDVYPKKGFQIHQDIPEAVWGAFYSLVSKGYTNHLIKE